MIYHHSLCLILFLAPHRPHLNRIHHNQVGLNWIYITWNKTSADNISNYQVRYSYTGACGEINRQEINQTIDSRNSSYNITGLRGYSNYSITLTAINDTGRSPPSNIVFAVTNLTGMQSK